MHERLIELIKQDNCISPFSCSDKCKYVDLDDCHSARLADHLLANGVIVLPCKVGLTIYVVSRYYAGDWEVYKCNIDSITIYEKNTFISCVANDVRFGKINFGLHISEIGKTVFLTREEAEQKLKLKEGN